LPVVSGFGVVSLMLVEVVQVDYRPDADTLCSSPLSCPTSI